MNLVTEEEVDNTGTTADMYVLFTWTMVDKGHFCKTVVTFEMH